MKVEFHVLQSFPPSCLNRDDTNTPKDCMFGGVRRARVSSQSWKRAIRMAFKNEEALTDTLAVRTKRLVENVVESLIANGRGEDEARAVAIAALAAVGIKAGEKDLTQYLLFLPELTARRFAAVVEANFDVIAAAAAAPPSEGKSKKDAKAEDKKKLAGDLKKVLEAALYDADKTPEIALFGRMIADLPDRNVDAAAQVAHAISTNASAPEFDFYTAVDDLKSRETDAGADMLGTIGFTAPCFYRYAVVDTEQLSTNLAGGKATAESRALAATSVAAFARGFVRAIPSARQNTMAAHTPPSFVLVVVRDGSQPVSLANAFERAVKPTAAQGVVGRSIDSLASQWSVIHRGLGTQGIRHVEYLVLTDDVTPDIGALLALDGVDVASAASLDALIAHTVATLPTGAP